MRANLHISQANYDALIDGVIQIGDEIRHRAATPLVAHTKEDDSPVTAVDHYAHTQIYTLLKHFTPNIPVLSEESSPEEQLAAARSKVRWVVDPIDGTKTLLSYSKGNRLHDGFGSHIALVDGDEAVCGIAHFPAMAGGKGATYFTDKDGKYAFKQIGRDDKQRIKASHLRDGETLKATVNIRTQRRPDTLCEQPYIPTGSVGGSRLCLAAEGLVHLADVNDIPANAQGDRGYKQWDVAAAHAILRAAGGELVAAESGKPIRYHARNEGDYRVPGCYGASRETFHALGLKVREAALVR